MQYKRIMCLDYGEARIGIALSDLLQTISTPYDTYTRKTLEEDLSFFENLAKIQSVEKVVIGLPFNMDGTAGERIEATKKFAEVLQSRLNLPIEYVDERLSSVEAEDILREAKIPPLKRKGLIDKIAAGIILETYLNSQK